MKPSNEDFAEALDQIAELLGAKEPIHFASWRIEEVPRLCVDTARAHELGKTHDWVVIYRDDGRSERQATVVTETHGPLAGCRVVRGRERECWEYYKTTSSQATGTAREVSGMP